MVVWQLAFWICVFVLFYNYAGYAIVARILSGFRKQAPDPPENFFPTVSFIVAAYNEESVIVEKILNSLEQNYPQDLIEFIFVTDGSSDRTSEMVAAYSQIKHLHKTAREGKTAALNRAVSEASNEILIFSDANTLLNADAVRNIARHYHSSKVGGVAGEKKVIRPGADPHVVGSGEGIYWKYESLLKKIDSDFYSVVGAAGELFSIRRKLYKPLDSNIILDDFVISLGVAANGFRVVYEPNAFAMELPSYSIDEEGKRKVRIAAGGFQAMSKFSNLLAFWRHFRLSYLYISHRVLRWTLSPLSLIICLLANLILVFETNELIYLITMCLQIVVYMMALLAAVTGNERFHISIFRFTNYFLFMNYSVVLGFFRYDKPPAGNLGESPENRGRRLVRPFVSHIIFFIFGLLHTLFWYPEFPQVFNPLN